MLALALVELRAGLFADLLGKLQHLDACRQQRDHLVQAPHEVEGLQNVLLLLVLRVDQVGDDVGQHRSRCDAAHHPDQFVRHMGQQSDRFDGPLLELQEARLDLRPLGRGLFDHRDPRHQEGPALQEFQHPEAGLALHYQVMGAFRSGDVAHDRARRADPVQIGRRDIGFLGVALQQKSRPQLALDDFLRGPNRDRPTHRHRREHAGKQHRVAQGDHDQRVLGQGPGDRAGLRRDWLPASGSTRAALAGPHLLPRKRMLHRDPFTLLNVSSRQPSTSSWPAGSRACIGSAIRRWNRP